MNRRIKELRQVLHMNQTEFGNRIGVKQSTITGYETGSREPLETVINSICREFNVNESWLRTGEGSMFNETISEEEIPLDDFLEAYTNLKPKDKKLLMDIMISLAGMKK